MKMNGFKERKRSPCSLEDTNKDSEATSAVDVPRTIGRYPSLSHQISLEQNDDSESNKACWRSEQNASAYFVERNTDFNDLASLTCTESDDGMTDSSDDSYTSRSRTTKTELQHGRKPIGDNANNSIDSYTNAKPPNQCEIGKYMSAREMSSFQEHTNALTVLPSSYYCIMFLLSGSWLSKSFIEAYENEMVDVIEFDNSQCISWSWLPHLHALPPLPTLAAAIGILCHAPFSMIYHWNAARLPPGLARTTHWSRRMDQAMIHICCTFMTYCSSGRLDYFLANVLFSIDCIYKQFLQDVRPRRNQVRIAISVIAYTTPILLRGDFLAYLKLAILLAVSGWLFGQYPIGGWSHSVFHIVLAFIPPIMFSVALDLPSSQSQLEIASHCAILAKSTSVS